MANNTRDDNVDVRILQHRFAQLSGAGRDGLKSGDGGGTSDGMEPRVKRLEDRLDKLYDKVGAVEVGIATLTERVAHLPSKGFIVTSLATAVVIIGGLVMMADRIKGMLS